MNWSTCVFSISFLLFSLLQETLQMCLKRESMLKSIIRGNYQNVLNYNEGALISSKLSNSFAGGLQGSCFRNNIYWINGGYGFIAIGIGNSIIFDLQKKFELNTFKIWLWDQDNRYYQVKAYILLNNVETKIYESNFGQSLITITFPNQLVQGFKVQNVNGNTYNSGLHIIKVEAYYKLSSIK